MKIAIIGTGNLGKSIAKGLITNNAITTLYLTKRNLDDIKEFEGYKNVTLTTDNIEAVKQSDILIFAVQPAHFENILNDIKHHKCHDVIDWWHNSLVKREIVDMYWAHPPLTEQGSHNGMLNAGISSKSNNSIRKLAWRIQKFYKQHILGNIR